MRYAKILIVTNIENPYRHLQFQIISKSVDLSVYFTHHIPKHRNWSPVGNTDYRKEKNLIKLLLNRKFEKIVVIENGLSSVCYVALFCLALIFKGTDLILWVGNNEYSVKSRLLKRLLYRVYFTTLSIFYRKALYYSEKSKTFFDRYNLGRRVENFSITGQQYPFQQEYGCAPQKAILIPDIRNRPVRFLFIGQDIERKGLKDIVGELNYLNNVVCQGISVQLAGGVFEEIVSQLTCDTSVIPFANADCKKALFRGCDFLLVPSKHEPWGHVVTEALGFGVLPIISSSAGVSNIPHDFYSIPEKLYIWRQGVVSLKEIMEELKYAGGSEFNLSLAGYNMLFNLDEFARELRKL